MRDFKIEVVATTDHNGKIHDMYITKLISGIIDLLPDMVSSVDNIELVINLFEDTVELESLAKYNLTLFWKGQDPANRLEVVDFKRLKK